MANLAPYGSSPISINLLNGSSKAMNVNGSSTNQTFSYSPTGSQVVIISGMTVLLRHDGSTPFSVFGALGSALTNGLLLQTTINSTTSTLATIKDNGDLASLFPYNQFGSSAILSILSVVTPEGFGASNNVFVGHLDFPTLLELQAANSDSLSAIVKDNLSSVGTLQLSVQGMLIA